MPVIRTYSVNHNFLRDHRLSYKARGVLAYLMDHGGEWEIRVEKLVADSEEDGRIAVQSALQELLKWHYAELVPMRNEAGKVKGKEYKIYNVPLDMQPHRQAGNLSVGCPKCYTNDESYVDTEDHRRAGNLPVGTDEQENRQSENLPVGGSAETGVDAGAHRRAGFTTVGKHDSQETCLTTLKNKPKDLTHPIVPPSQVPAALCVGETPDLEQVEPYGDPTAQSFRQGRAYSTEAAQVLKHLNKATGMHYSEPTQIKTRLRGGATVADCCLVIDWIHLECRKKQADWVERCLNNDTPFKDATRFDKYLAQARDWQGNQQRPRASARQKRPVI